VDTARQTVDPFIFNGMIIIADHNNLCIYIPLWILFPVICSKELEQSGSGPAKAPGVRTCVWVEIGHYPPPPVPLLTPSVTRLWPGCVVASSVPLSLPNVYLSPPLVRCLPRPRLAGPCMWVLCSHLATFTWTPLTSTPGYNWRMNAQQNTPRKADKLQLV